MSMRIDILTLFPDAVNAMMSSSILGRAQTKGAIEINCVQIRDFTTNKQQQVDDYPYGGGWGCVMMAQPLKACLDHVTEQAGERKRRVIYMSPQGQRFDQNHARRLVSEYDHLVLVCGHYEGVDERFIELCCDEELSVGDFVLTGGEIPAMAIADSVCRMVPGVLSDPECYIGESHWDGLLEYPQYTRPEVWEGMEVPAILRGGNHSDVAVWRREQQLIRTQQKRPDLFAQFKPETKADIRTVLRLTGREKLTYDCRRAEPADVPELMSIARDGIAYLKEQGVPQWQDGFPNEQVFADDIENGECWLFTHDDKPAGCMVIYYGDEKDYANINGAWIGSGPYAAVHRVCVHKEYRSRGLVDEMLQLAEDLICGHGMESVRIDTHELNKPMQKVLMRRGYTRRGILMLTDTVEVDKKRIGFEKPLV